MGSTDCPKCGIPMILQDVDNYVCPDPECGYEVDMFEDPNAFGAGVTRGGESQS